MTASALIEAIAAEVAKPWEADDYGIEFPRVPLEHADQVVNVLRDRGHACMRLTDAGGFAVVDVFRPQEPEA